jgi:cytochrome c oxidase assembly factor CtaG
VVPVLLLPLLGVAAVYERAGRRAGFAPTRRAAFLCGLAVLAVALLPAIEARAETSFVWHMVQHQLLTLVAAPLLAVGRPWLAWLALRGRTPRRAPEQAGVGVGARAVLAGVLALGTMLAWHLPPLYEAALADPRLHAIEHVSLLGSAFLLWSAIWAAAAGARTVLAAVLAAAIGAIGGAALGVLLLTAPDLLYPWYADQPDALAGQRIGGALMKVGTLVVHVGVAVSLVVRWLSAQDEPRPSPAVPSRR